MPATMQSGAVRRLVIKTFVDLGTEHSALWDLEETVSIDEGRIVARSYLLDNLFAMVPPTAIRFISMGGLRMSPGLRSAARRRFPDDPMLAGEEVLSGDGRYRTFMPLRARLFRVLSERIGKQAPGLAAYLCMESATMSERIFGRRPPNPASLGEQLAKP